MENVYRSYYTKSDYITSYMVGMLDLREDDLVLEPSGGEGVFIDALMVKFPNVRIETCDLNKKAVEVLKEKYKNNLNVKSWESDTLMDTTFDKYVSKGGYYDKVIGNPPYGGWQDFERRKSLKVKYAGEYVKETYSLFLQRGISLLKEDGVLSFIIPDTFLFLNRHTALRSFLLTNTKIKEILIFPSKLFPDVSFGYSKLSIITVQKAKSDKALSNNVRIIKGIKRETDLQKISLNENLEDFMIKDFNQQEVYNTQDHVFLINKEEKIIELIQGGGLKLADVANCVTGIYCGDNLRFMGVASNEVKGGKNYKIINEEKITTYIGLEGTDDADKNYIPLTKGNSSTRYVRERKTWYLDWSKEAIAHYTTDKKARFQNSQFYFKTGIALPMVKSSSISATLIENTVFDQSVVGVFPKEEKYMFYLLGLLNSEVVNRIIQTINPTANNSANYIKKIPIIFPQDDNSLEYVSNLVLNIIENIKNKDNEEAKDIHDKINKFFEKIYLV